MQQIEDKLSLFIKEQFPAFYSEEGETFRIFLEAYYEYLEQTGKSLDYSRNLLEYHDIDSTTNEFLDEFKKTFLADLPGLIKTDDRLTIKNIMDFYRAKGSPRSIQLLFRIIFDQASEVTFPSDDVLKPSSSEFRKPRYVEVYAPDMDKLTGLEGLEIVGSTSGAKAFVETISTKLINGVRIHIVQLSNLRGNFIRGEILGKVSEGGILDDMPVVVGSLSDVIITLGGKNNKVGDTFNITADVGKGAQARVTSVKDATGLIDFQLANGGFGFSTNTDFTNINVNDQHIEVSNVISTAQAISNTIVTLGANAHDFFAVGQSISTDVSGANGVVTAIGDASNASGSAPNTQIEIANMYSIITTSDKIANSTNGNTTVTDVRLHANNLLARVENAGYNRLETVDQTVERLTILSGSTLNTQIQNYINHESNINGPYVIGTYGAGGGGDAANVGVVVANGHIIGNVAIDGANATYHIAPHSGTFGTQKKIEGPLAVTTHVFQDGENINEENLVTLSVSQANTFGVGQVVTGNSSGANGVVVTSTSDTVTLNGSFGVFTTDDYITNSTSTNSANVTNISITASGANGTISSAVGANSTYANQIINVANIQGVFDTNKKILGSRSKAIMTVGTNENTGASDIFYQGQISVNAVVDTFANVSVSGQVIGSNNTNIGFRNSKFSNGATGTFYQNTAAYIVGRDSNTYANVVTVGTGSGAGFKIGTLENEEAITIYTDIIGGNNVANISYLDCIIDGGNSSIGFLDSVAVDNGGSGYVVGDQFKALSGGAGNGAPTTIAVANVSSIGAGGTITGMIVNTAGSGYFSTSPLTYQGSGGSSAVLDPRFDFGYGFPKDDNGDFTTILDNVLTRFSGNVGTIAAFSEINPGNNYNFDPFLLVRTQGIANFDRRDIIVTLTNMEQSGGSTKEFTIGEVINQEVTNAGQALALSSFSGTHANGDSFTANTAMYDGIGVVQVIDATNNAHGLVYNENTSHVSVRDVRIKTYDASSNLFTISTACNEPFYVSGTNKLILAETNTTVSAINAEITDAGTISQSEVAKGEVYKFEINEEDNTGLVGIRRLSFSVGFNESGTIQGATSTAGGTIDKIFEDGNTAPIGDNAQINADAQAANGIITGLDITDSGFGYRHGANLTLVSTNTAQPFVATGTANVNFTGEGPGYWASKDSFLNTKYIHDNDFYQEYSYVVESGLSLNKYRDILLKASHIAGTKLFGRVRKEALVNNAVTVSNSAVVTGTLHAGNNAIT